MDLVSGRGIRTRWAYHGAKYAWKPSGERPEVPPVSSDVVVIPANQKFIIDVGDGLPDTGIMRVRVRAARMSADSKHMPTLRLHFGNQGSNDSRVSVEVGGRDITIDAPPGKPRFYQWDVPLTEIPRNAFRATHKLGQLPNPAEFIDLRNTSSTPVSLAIDYVQIIAPAFEQWPPESHMRIFHERKGAEEKIYAREVLTRFMARAWPAGEWRGEPKARAVREAAAAVRGFSEAMVEVLASVLASPEFCTSFVATKGKPANQRVAD